MCIGECNHTRPRVFETEMGPSCFKRSQFPYSKALKYSDLATVVLDLQAVISQPLAMQISNAMTTTKSNKARKKEARRAAARAANAQNAASVSAGSTAPAASGPLQGTLRAVAGSHAHEPDPDPSLQSAAAIQSCQDACAKCGTANTTTTALTTCSKCNVTGYCSKTHATAHAQHHRATCMVLQADAVAAALSAPLTELLHAALLRLLYNPLRAVRSMQALMHVLDNRIGNYTESDLRDAPTFPHLRRLMHQHPAHGMGTLRATVSARCVTPLESCKLATTVLLMMCAQVNGQGTSHLMQSAAWLSQSKGAFAGSHLKRPNAADKTFRSAVSEAVTRMQEWTPKGGVGSAPRRGICLGVGVVDCAVFRQPWLGGCAHHFALVLAPVATTESDSNSKGKSFVGRLYQAYGPPDIGYSLRQNAYVGGGSHSMSEQEVWQYVDAFETMHSCKTWGEAKPHYVRVFGAEPRLSNSYPLELHVYTRASEFSEESLRCMCQVHAELLDVPYAVLP